MDYQKKIQDFILKLRGLPESQRKIIILCILGFLGIIMFFFAVISTGRSLSKIQSSLKDIEFGAPGDKSNEGEQFKEKDLNLEEILQEAGNTIEENSRTDNEIQPPQNPKIERFETEESQLLEE